MLQPRAPRTPHTSSSLVSVVSSLILSPPEGVTDPWAAAYELLIPVFQPRNVREWYFAILYVCSAAWVVLWLLALAALIVRTRRIGFALFTRQAGLIVPATTTLFLTCMLCFLGVAQGYLWRTIALLRSWRNYPMIVALQATTWTMLSVTAFFQAWGMVCAANFTGNTTRLLHLQHRPRTHRGRSPSRPSSAAGSSSIGRPFIPPFPFNLVFVFVLPAAFTGAVIATSIFSSRSCSSSFAHFRDTMDLLLNASSHSASIAETGQTQAVLAELVTPLEGVETQGAICQTWARVYYALWGICPALLLVAEIAGFVALYRQLSAQLSLLNRALSSTRRWQEHEASFQQTTSLPLPPVVPLSLPPRPATAESSVPHTPTGQQSFGQHPNLSAPKRLQRLPSSTSVAPNWNEAIELQKSTSITEESAAEPAWVERNNTYPAHAWVEAKVRQVKRARRNLVLQTAAFNVGALNYGAMAWITFAGAGISGVITIWSFVAMPIIALPILLTLLVNGLSGDIEQGFIGLVHVPETVAVPLDDEEEEWTSPTATRAEKAAPSATAIIPGLPRTNTNTSIMTDYAPHTHPRSQPPASQRFASRRLPSWTFNSLERYGNQDTDRASVP